MKILKEFWRDNKKGYFTSCIILSLVGIIPYFAVNSSSSIEGYLTILPFLWLGCYIFALGIHSLMYKKGIKK